MATVQSDLYELADSENRLQDLENTFEASTKLIGENREELEMYIEKIETIQRDIENNIQKSTDQKQEETRSYIRKILIENYKNTTEIKESEPIYEILLRKTFGRHITERENLNIL